MWELQAADLSKSSAHKGGIGENLFATFSNAVMPTFSLLLS